MTQRELARTLMPLSGMDKDKTRALARSLGLPVAEKPDSQDVCFIPDGDYIRFLEEYAGYQGQKGPFRSIDGEILGWHKGIAHYTIGQRKGLGTAFGQTHVCDGGWTRRQTRSISARKGRNIGRNLPRPTYV